MLSCDVVLVILQWYVCESPVLCAGRKTLISSCIVTAMAIIPTIYSFDQHCRYHS